VSVGATLGGLGLAIQEEFPDAYWESIDFSAITPEHPEPLYLHQAKRNTGRLRMAVLATPQEDGIEGSPTLDAVGAAVTAAIRLAPGPAPPRSGSHCCRPGSWGSRLTRLPRLPFRRQ
jgi:hypothetical protein